LALSGRWCMLPPLAQESQTVQSEP
jgi:hypothetical protein